MSITRNNIADFITFLFRKRKNQSPPQELLNGWTALSNEEITSQLNGLFQSWGLTEEDKRMEINAFFKETLFSTKTQPVPAQRVPPVVNQPQTTAPFVFNKKKKSKWPYFVIVLLAVIGCYIGYQYMGYSSMKYVYTITDNVSVRNEAKEIIARMDLFEVQGTTPSFQKLKAVDDAIYPRSIDDTEKTYPCRKVLVKDVSFFNYLFKRNDITGYVNTNYVVDSDKEFTLYQTAFKEVKNSRAENSSLTAIYRKIIIGSMGLDNANENRYIALHTQGLPKSAINATFGIIKQTIKENIKYVIIAGLSDGYYYSFEGDVRSNTFEAPEQIMITTAEGENKPLSGAYRFMNRENKIILYDCLLNAPTNYEAKKESSGKITSFKYEAPTLIEEIQEIFE